MHLREGRQDVGYTSRHHLSDCHSLRSDESCCPPRYSLAARSRWPKWRRGTAQSHQALMQFPEIVAGESPADAFLTPRGFCVFKWPEVSAEQPLQRLLRCILQQLAG